MRALPRPDDDAREVFQLCISRVQNRNLRKRLSRISDDVERAARAFDAAGSIRDFFRIAKSGAVRDVTQEELLDVYTSRMAKKRAPGREVYEKLRASTELCPLCGQRTVSTLDHYLPKASYSLLSTVPVNLVPACADCNKTKLAVNAEAREEQTLHPYYDNVARALWLKAEVIEEHPPALRFFAEPGDDWDAIDAARVVYHFSTFKLGSLYASHAAAELANIEYSVAIVSETTGPEGVAAHLTIEATSRRRVHVNSWQTAFYTALASSAWYCEGGFHVGGNGM